MSAIDKEAFPRGALIAIGLLVGFSLAATTAIRLARLQAPAPSAKLQAPPARSVDLWFVDEPDGSVSVRGARDAAPISRLAPGTNGFVRGVMRGLAHDRKVRGIGPAAPFRLSQWAGGRMVLDDTATGRRIDLDAFGVTNKDAFADLFKRSGTS